MDDALEVDGGGGALPRLAVAEVLVVEIHVVATEVVFAGLVVVRGQRAVKVVGIQQLGGADLLQVGGAGDGLRLFTGLRQRGQQHGGQDGDDGDDDQQFNQREVFFILFHVGILFF